MDNYNNNYDPQNGQQNYQQPYQQPYQQNYQQQYQQPYQQAPYQEVQNPDQVVSLGDWMITMLICWIPIVGLVMMFVWAFGNSNPSKRNWARAALLWAVIAFVFYMIIFIMFGAMITAGLSSMMY